MTFSDNDSAGSSPARIDRRGLILTSVVLSGLVIFLLNSGSIPLMDRDEGRYAEIGREMFVSGNWLIPSLFGVPYLEKPPLLYWLLSVSYSLFGINEFTARLPIALVAGGGVAIVGVFARRVMNPLAGIFAAAVLATSALYVVLARVVVTDMLFAVALSAAMLAFFVSESEILAEYSGYFLFWFALALATLAKGPIAVVIFGLVGGIHLSLERRWRVLTRVSFWATCWLFGVVTLPWFVIVQRQFSKFLSFYIYDQHLARFAGSEHKEAFYFFLPVLLAGLMPWTPLAFAGLPTWMRKWKESTLQASAVRFLSIWALVVFVIFSASAGKLMPYILPMFPAMAILIGYACSKWCEAVQLPRAATVAVYVTAALLATVGIGCVVALRVLDISNDISVGIVVILGALVLTIEMRRKIGSTQVLGTLAVSGTALFLAAAFAVPDVTRSLTAKDALTAAQASLRPGDELAMTEIYYPSEAFYLARFPYVVNPNRELEFGEGLVGGSPFLVPDLATLKSRTHGHRVLCLTGVKPKYLSELKTYFPDAQVVTSNRVAVLVMLP